MECLEVRSDRIQRVFVTQNGEGHSGQVCAQRLILSLAGAATSRIFEATQVLPQQTHVCHDKLVLVVTKHVCFSEKVCLSQQQNFMTKLCWSGQTCVCRNKTSVVTNICLLRQKFCRDKHNFVLTNICHKHTFVVTKTRVCHNKTFVATQIILVSAPANGKIHHDQRALRHTNLLFLQLCLLLNARDDLRHVGFQHHSPHDQFRQNVMHLKQ